MRDIKLSAFVSCWYKDCAMCNQNDMQNNINHSDRLYEINFWYT